jgi:sugar lactone lactonase YvrE
MAYGSGKFVYEYVPGWAKIPAGWKWGNGAGVAVDAQDNVFLFNRTDHPVIIFDRNGNFLRSWGEGIFDRPHGVFITPDQFVWGSDDAGHVIHKFDLNGKLITTMGVKGRASDSGYIHEGDLMQRLNSIKRSAGPFNRPTKLVVAPWGEMYVSDGYGNASVHRFTGDGKLITTWGGAGHGPGEFFLPHGLAIDGRERILVADRENSRVQIFAKDGKLLGEWADLARPGDVAIDQDGVIYISESPKGVCIKDLDGQVLSRFDAVQDKVLRNAHSLTVDSRGDIYVVEIAEGSPTIKKFVRQ